uniref:Uncharacterized protein n=1 Tax=Romanomermis culicivorax TaxID=13658 RepID=A0A915KAC8_ROMCU
MVVCDIWFNWDIKIGSIYLELSVPEYELFNYHSGNPGLEFFLMKVLLYHCREDAMQLIFEAYGSFLT